MINIDKPYSKTKIKEEKTQLKSEFDTMMDEIINDFNNAKLRGELSTRVFFNPKLPMIKGIFGKGMYGKGVVVDRNVEDSPKNMRFIDKDLIFTGQPDNIQDIYYNGYRAIKYGEDDYYIFPDTFENNDYDTSKIYKSGNRWFIRGNEKPFRNPKSANNYMEKSSKKSLSTFGL